MTDGRDTLRCLDCEALLMSDRITHVAKLPGLGQVLITTLSDGTVHVAWRMFSDETWTPATVAERA